MSPSSVSPPSLEDITKASRYPPIIFISNPVNSDFRATLMNSLVLKDIQGLDVIYIQTHLSQAFLI
jgi:hypothetical protein